VIGSGQWERLRLEQNLVMVEEKNPGLFSDPAIRGYLRVAFETVSRSPPRIPRASPTPLPIPISTEDLLEQLDAIESVDDLLGWILDSFDDIALDTAVQLFQAVLERGGDRVQHTQERYDYERGNLCVNAAHWIWKG
jgi:hypothetical protein